MTQQQEQPYEVGARLEYRHKGKAQIGRFVKAQRRKAVLEDQRGRIVLVPWTSIVGAADHKKAPAPRPEGRIHAEPV